MIVIEILKIRFILRHTFNGHFTKQAGLTDTRRSPFWILLEQRMMEVVMTTGVYGVQSSGQIFTTNKSTLNDCLFL